ncbi:ParA family protein [Cyanobacteria bacterium FACHB-63]|nr:ParA family protein [Cyanobacteria bacterium FACHB-63]
MIITIASFKGGVGKTTTALHLAQYLGKHRGSSKVVLLDGDPIFMKSAPYSHQVRHPPLPHMSGEKLCCCDRTLFPLFFLDWSDQKDRSLG